MFFANTSSAKAILATKKLLPSVFTKPQKQTDTMTFNFFSHVISLADSFLQGNLEAPTFQQMIG